MPGETYEKLTAKDLLKKYSEGIRDFPNVNLLGKNLKKADLQEANFSGSQLQGANFSGAKLQNCDFGNTRLHRANFSKAILTGAKFNNTETGMGFGMSLFSFIITVIVSVVGIILADVIAILFASYLYSLLTNPQSKTQYMIIIAYIVVSIVGFWHFWVITLLKNIDEAVCGILVTILTILLFMLGQPLTNVLAWCIILGGGIRLTKVLFDWKNFAAFLPISSFIIVILGIIYNYEYIQKQDISVYLIIIYGLLFASLISSPILASLISSPILVITVAQIKISTITCLQREVTIPNLLTSFKNKLRQFNWEKFVSLICLVFKWFLPVFFLVYLASLASIIAVFIITYIGLIVGIVSIPGIPGIYIGWQALRDNPKYRLIRDCGVWLSNCFGTNFREADLTNADFSGATLQNANFTKAILKHTQWQGAKRMQYARFGNSYLRYSKIRKLMINSNP
jgi:hypothetical protein